MSRLLFPILFAGIAMASAREVQSHGLVFEKWLRDTFFGGYTPGAYTQKWDVPAEANPEHGRIPVNPKAAKYHSPVDFGDALRQHEIAEKKERFLLIVGFWEQETATEKRWVNVQTVEVAPETWATLWHPITRADLEKLVNVIKDKSMSLEETRRRAREIKSRPPFSNSVMQVNPKIDGSQRRLQCSLRFADFFDHLAPSADRERQDRPKVFGVAIPERFESAGRGSSPANKNH